MKRCRILGLFIALCAACAAFCAFVPSIWAQGAESVLRGRVAQPNPAVEAAKKEVADYQVAFAKMEKEKGWAAASRFFLTPDYKETNQNGVIRTKNEHIRHWADTFARINKERSGFAQQVGTEIESSHRDIYETIKATAQENTIVVTAHVIVPKLPAESVLSRFTSGTSVNGVSPRRMLNTIRRVYRRTPNGLRLEQEVVTVRPYSVLVSESGEVIRREP